MMYGRKPLIPWQIENDLGHLDMSQELPDFTIEETIEKIENLQQVLEMAAGNIKKAQAHQAKTYNAKHARNDFEVGAKVWKKNPLWNTKQKSLKKGPMWRGPYEVEGKTQAGNYLLKGVKGKGKGKIRNAAIPPNQLKRHKSTQFLYNYKTEHFKIGAPACAVLSLTDWCPQKIKPKKENTHKIQTKCMCTQ